MQKVIVFTDIHIVPEGETIIGLDPAARFAEGLAHAVAHHPDAARIVICGDLTHHGTPDEYRRLRGLLQGCPLPVSLMLGNHDRRAPFLKVFSDVEVTEEGFVQAAVDLGEDWLILLDTLDEAAADTHCGALCAHRLDWLEKALDEAGNQRITVFTHHPPILTGFDGMDAIGLANRTDFIARLKRHPNIAQIISGHVHRTISGSANGIPVAIFKGTCHQMPMTLGPHDTSLSIDEPGAYGLLLLQEESVIVHTEDFTLPGHTAEIYAPAQRVAQ